MSRDGAQAKYARVHVRFGCWNLDRECQIVILRYVYVLAAVPIVVPWRNDIRRLKEEEHECEVIGSNRFPIGPAGGRVEFHIDGSVFPIYSPRFSKTRIEVEVILMSVGDVDRNIIQQKRSEGAVGIGAYGSHGARKILYTAVLSAAFLCLWRTHFGEGVAVFPGQVYGKVGDGFKSKKIGVGIVVGLDLGRVIGLVSLFHRCFPRLVAC